MLLQPRIIDTAADTPALRTGATSAHCRIRCVSLSFSHYCSCKTLPSLQEQRTCIGLLYAQLHIHAVCNAKLSSALPTLQQPHVPISFTTVMSASDQPLLSFLQWCDMIRLLVWHAFKTAVCPVRHCRGSCRP